MSRGSHLAIGLGIVALLGGVTIGWKVLIEDDSIVMNTCADRANDLTGFGDLTVLDRLPVVDLTNFELTRDGDVFTATFTVVESLRDLDGLAVTGSTRRGELPSPAPPDGGESSVGWYVTVSDGSGPSLSLGVSVDLLGPVAPTAVAEATLLKSDELIALAGTTAQMSDQQIIVKVDAAQALLGDAVTARASAERFFRLDPAIERELAYPDVTRAGDECGDPVGKEPSPTDLVLGEDLQLWFDGRGGALNTLGDSLDEIVTELTRYFGAEPDVMIDGPCVFPRSGPMTHVRWGGLHLFGAQGMWVGWVLSADDRGRELVQDIAGGGIRLFAPRHTVINLGVELTAHRSGFEFGATADGTLVAVDPRPPGGTVVGLAGGVPCDANGYRFNFDD